MLLKKATRELRSILSVAIIAALFTSSCGSSKNMVYFNGYSDKTLQTSNIAAESLIRANDLISITVSSLNPEATKIFNTPNNSGISSTAINGNNTQAFGYLVSSEGDIQFPMLGNIHTEGLTKDDLKDSITKALVDKELLIDPVVNVRLLNFKVTVLGEVLKPAVYAVPSEKISLLEAIGLAGDLTIYAKRNNVMIIREENNKKITKHVNLSSPELFTSPYYYLKSNDIVYVEPNKNRLAGASVPLIWAPVITGVISLGVILISNL